MNALFSRAAWTRPYALPFVGLFAFNILLFAVFTLPRSLYERARAREAMELRQAVEAKRSDITSVRVEADVIKANGEESRRFYEERTARCSEARARINIDVFHIIKDLGVRWERLGFRDDAIKGVPKLREIEISMPVAGTYQQVATLLQRLERSQHFLIVDRIDLKERTGNEGGADLNIKVLGYCRPDEPATTDRSSRS